MAGLKVITLRDAVLATNRQGPVLIQVKLLASPAAVAVGPIGAEQALTVTGLAAGDIIVSAQKPSGQASLALSPGRAAANLWYPYFTNVATVSVTPTAAEVYDLLVLRPAS